MGTGVSCQSVEVHSNNRRVRRGYPILSPKEKFVSKIIPASQESSIRSSTSKQQSTKRRASKSVVDTEEKHHLSPGNVIKGSFRERQRDSKGNFLSRNDHDNYSSSSQSVFSREEEDEWTGGETRSIRRTSKGHHHRHRQSSNEDEEEEKMNCSWCEKQRQGNDSKRSSIHFDEGGHQDNIKEEGNESEEKEGEDNKNEDMIQEETEDKIEEVKETQVYQEDKNDDVTHDHSDDDEEDRQTCLLAPLTPERRLSQSMMTLPLEEQEYMYASDRDERDPHQQQESLTPTEETVSGIPTVNLERVASLVPEDVRDMNVNDKNKLERQYMEALNQAENSEESNYEDNQLASNQATCNSTSASTREHGSLFDTFECNSMPSSSDDEDNDEPRLNAVREDDFADNISVDETSLAVNLRSESICTSCRSGCMDDEDIDDDEDVDLGALRAARGKRGNKEGCDEEDEVSTREDEDGYQVIEELELNKYEVQQPASELIQLQQQQLKQLGLNMGTTDPSKKHSSSLSRKGTKSSIITSVAEELVTSSSLTNTASLLDPSLLGIITQEGDRHTRKECNKPDCGLCFLIASSVEGNDWDELDTETVTIMDILERLSKILAEKAKSLINKKKQTSSTPTPGESKETAGKRAQDSSSPRVIKNQFRKEPLKGLKASGIAVKKVEHKRRVIVVKDGSSQYYIQGKYCLPFHFFARKYFVCSFDLRHTF